jgi:hypothetical protein
MEGNEMINPVFVDGFQSEYDKCDKNTQELLLKLIEETGPYCSKHYSRNTPDYRLKHSHVFCTFNLRPQKKLIKIFLRVDSIYLSSDIFSFREVNESAGMPGKKWYEFNLTNNQEQLVEAIRLIKEVAKNSEGSTSSKQSEHGSSKIDSQSKKYLDNKGRENTRSKYFVDKPILTTRNDEETPGSSISSQYINSDDLKKIGQEGEEWVFSIEKTILLETGREDLSDKVEWVSKTRGDGLGYDILSFDASDGSSIFIEVKTTNGGLTTAFEITKNELDFGLRNKKTYRLYRVFNNNTNKRQLYVMKYEDLKKCIISPITYRVKPSTKAK